jgi:hypothetical protein
MRRDPRKGSARLPRRGTDRLEDLAVWTLLLAGLLTAVLGLVVGIGASGTAAEHARQEGAARVAVPATLLHDAPVTTAAPGAMSLRVLADAGWTAPDGTARTGPAPVLAASRAGEAVTIWLDRRSGAPVQPPDDGSGAVVVGLTAGLIVLLVGGIVLTVVGLGVRHWIGVLNARGWEREWARVGPEWTGPGRHETGRATE